MRLGSLLNRKQLMNPELIFQLASAYVFLGWVALFAAPEHSRTQALVKSAIIVPLGLVYIFLVLYNISDFNPMSFSSLSGVMELFQNDVAVVAGWIHYLVFDLFVGLYIVRSGVREGMSRWMYTLCLPFTFMFGPFGLLLFWGMRVASRKK